MAGNLRPASRKEDGLGFYFDRDLEITSELQNQRVVAGTAKIINFKSMSRQEILPMEHQSSPTKARPLKSHDWPSSQMLESSTSPCSSQRYSENAQEYAGKKSTLSTRDPLYHLAHNLDVVLHKSLKSSSQQNEDASNQLANPRELVSAGYHCPQRLKAKPLQALPLNALPSHAASDDTYFYHLKETCSETVPVQRASSPTLATQETKPMEVLGVPAKSPSSPVQGYRQTLPTLWKQRSQLILQPPRNQARKRSQENFRKSSVTIKATHIVSRKYSPRSTYRGVHLDILHPEGQFSLRTWQGKPTKSHYDLYRPETLKYPPEEFPIESSPVFRVDTAARHVETTSIWRNLSIRKSEEIYRWIKIFEDVFDTTIRFMGGSISKMDEDWEAGEFWKDFMWPRDFFLDHMKQCYLEQFGHPIYLTTDTELIQFLDTRTTICSMEVIPSAGEYARLTDQTGSICYKASVGFGSTEEILDIRRFTRHMVIPPECQHAIIGRVYEIAPTIWDPHQPYANLEALTTYILDPPIPWLKWDPVKKMFSGVVPEKMNVIKSGDERSYQVSDVLHNKCYLLELCIHAFNFEIFPDNLQLEQSIKAELKVFIAPPEIDPPGKSQPEHQSTSTGGNKASEGFSIRDFHQQDPHEKCSLPMLENGATSLLLPIATCAVSNLKAIESTTTTLNFRKIQSPFILKNRRFETNEKGPTSMSQRNDKIEQSVLVSKEVMRQQARGTKGELYKLTAQKLESLKKYDDEVESSETDFSDDESGFLSQIPYVSNYGQGFWKEPSRPRGRYEDGLRNAVSYADVIRELAEEKRPRSRSVNQWSRNKGRNKEVQGRDIVATTVAMTQAALPVAEYRPRAPSDYSLPLQESPDNHPRMVERSRKISLLTSVLQAYGGDSDDSELEQLLPPPLSSPDGKVGISKTPVAFSLRERRPARKSTELIWEHPESEKENYCPWASKSPPKNLKRKTSFTIVGEKEETSPLPSSSKGELEEYGLGRESDEEAMFVVERPSEAPWSPLARVF